MKAEQLKILDKMRRYCSWRDRCSKEVEGKLNQFRLAFDERQQVLQSLLSDKYYDDNRFAESFVYTKIHHNKWGKLKIRHALRQKRIPEDIINNLLDDVDPELYSQNIKHLIEKKQSELHRKGSDNIRQKTFSYLMSRGFAADEITPNI